MKVLLCGEFNAAVQRDGRDALAAAMPEATWLDLVAARSDPACVQAAIVAANLRAWRDGRPAMNPVDRLRGY